MPGKRHKKQGRFQKAPENKPVSRRKLVSVLLTVIVLSAATIGGTLAYISANSRPVTNTFEPAQMSCVILEDFSDGLTKKDVRVQNTGDAPAYIRVKLLPYWYDKENDTIVAKTAWKPDFTPGKDWTLGADGYYYHTVPVEPGETTSALISSITLEQDAVSLSRQVLEIIASCIQAEPADAVKAAWSGSNGSVTNVTDGTLVVTAAGG